MKYEYFETAANRKSLKRAASGAVRILALCAALSIGLTGCSASSSGKTASESSANGTSIDGPAGSSRSGAELPGAPENDGEWISYEKNLQGLAASFKVKHPPQVEVRMWVKPEDESSYVDPCVKSKGFTQSGASWVNIAKDQVSKFNLAMYECMAAYPEIVKYTAKLTSSNLARVYDWTVNTEIPCLEQKGYSISDVPSQAVFIASYYTNPFFPYSQIPARSTVDDLELNKACPQWPTSEFLYGN